MVHVRRLWPFRSALGVALLACSSSSQPRASSDSDACAGACVETHVPEASTNGEADSAPEAAQSQDATADAAGGPHQNDASTDSSFDESSVDGGGEGASLCASPTCADGLVLCLTPFSFIGGSCVSPVSYTHLDVYKRQAQEKHVTSAVVPPASHEEQAETQ